jgi:prepilin signal peptidase PulO-like enzyme (type II secretory pathway)
MNFLVIIFGLIIGSFLNCLIWRLFKDESLWGRSYCPKCREKIAWYDNVPLLSYLLLKGKCRKCKNKISWQYPAVEFFTALLFFLSYHLMPETKDFFLLLFRNWYIISIAIIIFVFDIRWQLVSLTAVIPSIFVIFILNIFLGFSWWKMILSVAGVFLFFLAQYLITKKKGIGEGDIYLGILIGVIFSNFNDIFMAIFLTYFIGAIVGLFLMAIKRKKMYSKLPLGVFISIAILLVLFWSDFLNNWYFSLFSNLR